MKQRKKTVLLLRLWLFGEYAELHNEDAGIAWQTSAKTEVFCTGLSLLSKDMKRREFSEAQFKISSSEVWSKYWQPEHFFA